VNMRVAAALCALSVLVAATPVAGKDISADTLAILHDLLAPYRNDRAQGADERAAVLTAGLDALRREKLLDLPRPPIRSLGVAERLGQALALGRRTPDFLNEIATVRDALVRQDQDAAEQAIQTLYEKMGRKRPEGPALVALLTATRKVLGAAPQETDRTEIDRPDYTIVVENARSAGTAKVSVLMTNGPGGRPARVTFAGDVTTRPDAKKADLTTEVAPAAAPDFMTAAEADELEKKLNGKWRDQRGDEYDIAINGEAVMIAHRPGPPKPGLLGGPSLDPTASRKVRDYRGTYRVGTIRARFEITSADQLDGSLPAPVREQLARMNFGFRITLDAKDRGAKLDGTWSSQHVTYSADSGHKIDKVHSPYDVALVLTRTASEYRIAKLDIDYRPWQARQDQLRARLTLAEDDERRLTSRLTDALNVLEDRQRRAQEALKAFGQARSDWETADARFAAYALPDAAKSDAHRALEQRRDRLAQRVERLYDAILEASARREALPPAVFENHRDLSGERDRLNSELDKLAEDAGQEAERQRLSQASHEAFVAFVGSETEFLAAAAIVEKTRTDTDDLEAELLRAKAKAAEAAQALARFAASGPRIGGTWVDASRVMKYETTIWEPKELLDYLDSEIAGLGRVLSAVADRHREARDAFVSAQQDAIAHSDRLRNGIMRSAVAQGLTETGFNAWDVIEKTMEAGPVGALGEGAKKVAEAWILGPPTFYEPTLLPAFATGEGGPFSDITSNINDAGEYAWKRGVKTFGTSAAANRLSEASVIVQKYIETRSMRVYRELIDRAIVGSMETGYRIAGPTQARRAMEAFEALTKAQEGLRKAVRGNLFHNFAQIGRGSLIETFKEAVKARPGKDGGPKRPGRLQASVYKDVAKMAAKKFFAEWLEGVPLAEYMTVDAYARMTTQVFRASSGVYWQTRDDYDARVNERREVLRQYDPKNSMLIITDEPFADKTSLKIILRDGEGQWLPSAGREVVVKVGGKTATQVPGATLTYSLDATGLAHDGKGGVALEVIVTQ